MDGSRAGDSARSAPAPASPAPAERESPLAGTSAAALDALARTFPAGAVLFEEGDPGSRMYVLRSGRVKIAKRVGAAEVTLAILGPGEFFGEMALLERLPRTASATVLEEARLIEVDEETFASLLQRSSEIALRLLRRLSSRLREADRQIQALIAKGGVARMLDALRNAGRADGRVEAGARVLPAEVGLEELALHAGLRLEEAERAYRRLHAAGVVSDRDGRTVLAPESALQDFAFYLELQETYDPLTAEQLAELSGLPQDEVHRLVRRILDARLNEPGARAQERRLADTYQTYLELKKRFEYPDPSGAPR